MVGLLSTHHARLHTKFRIVSGSAGRVVLAGEPPLPVVAHYRLEVVSWVSDRVTLGAVADFEDHAIPPVRFSNHTHKVMRRAPAGNPATMPGRSCTSPASVNRVGSLEAEMSK